MVKSSLLGWLACGCVLAVAGCGGDVSRSFGLAHDTPDEFTVTTRAPLSMPPDFALRPPQPGQPRPQEQNPSKSAEATLAPQTALMPANGSQASGSEASGSAAVASDSPGEDALMQAAGPRAPSNIRAQVANEASKDSQGEYLIDKLMFWKGPKPKGVVVDPQKEADRLRQDAALGQSPDSSDTPVIRRKNTSLLDSIF